MSNLHSEERVVKLLLENEELTIRQAAKKAGIDYKAVYLKIMALHNKGIVEIRKAGNASLCILKRINCPEILQAEYSRKNEALKSKDLLVLYNRIKEGAKSPFFVLLLFGSHAVGNAGKASDIDLLLICDDAKTADSVRKIIHSTPLKTHLLFFSSEEFRSMLKTTEFNVGKEAAKKNIILFGAEDYYRLIE